MNRAFLTLMTIVSINLLPCRAQDKQFDIDVKKAVNVNNSEYVLEEIDLGENGYLIKTGVDNTAFQGQDLNLYYFKANGDLLWKVKIGSDYYDLHGKDRFIASPDGEIAYDIQIRRKGLQVHHIQKDGNVKMMDLSKYGITQNLQSAFCDTDYLYFLSTIKGDELHKSKKGTEQLILHRFANNGFSYKKFVMGLPQIAGDKSTSFWSFIGQNNSNKYLLSKTINPQTKRGRMKIASFDSEAVISSVVEFEISFPEHTMVFVSPSDKTSQGFTNYVRTDEREIPPTGNVSGRVEKFDASLAAVMLDQYNPYFYVTGVLQKENSTTSEFFINKYNLDGKALWSNTYKSDLAAETATNSLWDYYFCIIPNGLNFGYLNGGKYYLHDVAQDGALRSRMNYDYHLRNFRGYDNTIVKGKFVKGLSSGKLPRGFEQIDKLDGKEKQLGLFSNYVSSRGEIFTYCDRKGTLKVLFYKR